MGVKLSEWRLKLTDGITSVMDKVTAMADKAAGKYDKLQEKVNKFKSGVKDAANEVPGLNRVIALVSNPYVAIAAGIAAVVLGLGSATSFALTFEKGMAQVNTTAQLAPPQLAALKDRLIDMGTSSNVALENIPGAFNKILSAVGNTGQALNMFEPSLIAAKAGFTDIGVVGEALTNVMGSVAGATPVQVFDTLFATMKVGKAEFADIASYLPKILPLANNVGIKYQEIAAAFGMMTKEGQSSEQSAMLLQNAMTALGKSEVIYGTKSKAGFERSGIAIFDHQGKMRKLTQIVDDLASRTQGMTDKQRQAFLAGLGLDAQAASAFSIMASHAAELTDFAGQTTNSAGAMNAALKNSANTSDRIATMFNRIKGIALQIGYKMLPYVNAGIDAIDGSITWLQTHFVELKAGAQALGVGVGIVLATMGAQVAWMGAAWVVSMVSSLGATFLLEYGLLALRTALFNIPIVGWIAAAAAGFIYLYQTSSKFRAVLAGVGSVLLALWDPVKLLGMAIANLFNPAAFAANMMRFVQAVRNLNIKGSFNKGYDDSMAASAAAERATKAPKASPFAGLPGAGGKPKGSTKPAGVDAGIKSVNDGGRQQRNVTVNIDSLVKELKIMAGTVQGSGREMEDFIKETLIRAVSGAEQALQN